MGQLIVGDFGRKDGVQTYRINGSYEDLQRILDECISINTKFSDFPEIERLRYGQCTMLLKFYLPENNSDEKSK